ncbi:MAG TPA: mechanosensitive ion channel family protein, partial [Rectinemataceae bacterium]|nr:mechanosensitive ion channel family protein [Rectinemataceae bacterium]
GIVGIAIGFAAQTSVSNIISGLFLFSEKSFEIGDVIQLESISGVIESVDMLSIKLRTFDNRLVRIPNETMIKSNIVNVTRWPERRLDLTLTLPYGVDPTMIEALLRDTAMSVPAALTEPEPFFLVDSLGPNGIVFMFGVWFKKDNFLALKNGLLSGLVARFEREGLRPAVQVVSMLPPTGKEGKTSRSSRSAGRRKSGA